MAFRNDNPSPGDIVRLWQHEFASCLTAAILARRNGRWEHIDRLLTYAGKAAHNARLWAADVGADAAPIFAELERVRLDLPGVGDFAALTWADLAVRVDAAGWRQDQSDPAAPLAAAAEGGKRPQNRYETVGEAVQEFYLNGGDTKASTRAIAKIVRCSHTAVAKSRAYQLVQSQLDQERAEALNRAEDSQSKRTDRRRRQTHRSEFD